MRVLHLWTYPKQMRDSFLIGFDLFLFLFKECALEFGVGRGQKRVSSSINQSYRQMGTAWLGWWVLGPEFHLFIRRQGSFYRVLAVLSVLKLGLHKPGWPLRWGSPCCCTQPTVPFRLSPVCNPLTKENLGWCSWFKQWLDWRSVGCGWYRYRNYLCGVGFRAHLTTDQGKPVQKWDWSVLSNKVKLGGEFPWQWRR